MKKKKSLIKILRILILVIFVVILSGFAYIFHQITSLNHSTIYNTSEARKTIQEMFYGTHIDVSNASGYRESQWPGEYVSYYRFYAPSQEIDNVLNKFMFKETQYKTTLKFMKMNIQPDWWNPSELTQATIYSNGKRWLIYDKNIGLVYLYSSSGEFGVAK